MSATTTPKDRPILFSGAMVRALLDGRKTQSRRVVKPQPNNPNSFGMSPIWGRGAKPGEPYTLHAATNVNGERVDRFIACPYGAIGDRLWCRETWGEVALFSNAAEGVQGYRTVYRADPGAEESVGGYLVGDRWKPSIHMPRWASRLTLEITSIRVERVQDISDHDAMSEGLTCQPDNDGAPMWLTAEGWPTVYPAVAYASLWDSINGKRPGCSWEANPWVWVLEFRRVSEEGAPDA